MKHSNNGYWGPGSYLDDGGQIKQFVGQEFRRSQSKQKHKRKNKKNKLHPKKEINKPTSLFQRFVGFFKQLTQRKYNA